MKSAISPVRKRQKNPVPGKAELAVKMKAARMAAGMSQQEVGDLMNTEQAHVSEWERGNFEPKVHNLVRFARVVGADMNALTSHYTDGLRS